MKIMLLHGIAFAELVAYMEDFRMEGSVAPVFKLADLAHLYELLLEQLGGILGRPRSYFKIETEVTFCLPRS